MPASKINGDRRREATRRVQSENSVFIPALAGTHDEAPRVVLRHEVHLRALEAARKVIREYHVDRQRQI